MASKRLNKYMREVFIKAVMNDVPMPNEETCGEEFREILFKQMPECVQQTYRLYPEWLDDHSHSIHVRNNGGRWFYLRYKWNSYSNEKFGEEAKQYISRLEEIIEERDKFASRLEEIVNSVSTIKDLKTILPEFAKYAPDDTPNPTKNLPICDNLMAEVVKLGWPGGKIVNAEVCTA